MDFADLLRQTLESIVSFSKTNPLLALCVLAIFAFSIYRKPILVLSIFFLFLLLAGVLYVISDMAGSGTSQKKRLLNEGRVPENIVQPSRTTSFHFLQKPGNSPNLFH